MTVDPSDAEERRSVAATDEVGRGDVVPETTARLSGLDGLRAIAISLVVLLHASKLAGFPQNPLLLAVAGVGGFGVTVFFVVSGFLITHLLITEQQRTGVISMRRFYVRRAFRILPAAYAYVFIVSLIAWSVGVALGGPEIASSLLFVRNLTEGSALTAHFWTLAIEEQFYLIWPVVLWMCPPRMRLWVTLLLCVVAPVWRQANMELAGAAQLNWGRADFRYDALLAGGVIAILRAEGRCTVARKLVSRYSGSFVSLAVLLVVGIVFFAEGNLPGWIGVAIPSLQYSLLAIITLGVVDGESPWIRRLLDVKPLVAIGRLSYSLYLWQQPFLLPWTGANSLAVLFSLAAALLAAAASYSMVERPFLRLRESWQTG